MQRKLIQFIAYWTLVELKVYWGGGREEYSATRMRRNMVGFRMIWVVSRVYRGGGRRGVVGGQNAGEDLLQPHNAVGALVAAPPEGERACAQE